MITIARQQKLNDRQRTYKILVDEKFVHKIKNGETVELEISEGLHTLKLAVDWCESNIIEFEVTKDSELSFICFPSPGIKLINMLIYKDKYITLCRR